LESVVRRAEPAQPACAICGQPIDPDDPNARVEFEGWRHADGEIVPERDTGRLAHAACIARAELKRSPDE
jgi:hypothetical protein